MKKLPVLWLGAASLFALVGCPGAGPSDAGPSDGGPSDAGPSDAGPSDGGPSDGGPSQDDGGGSAVDGGAEDGGGGEADAGPAALCTEPATGPDEYEHQVHHFLGPDEIEVWLTREYEGFGAGHTSVWSASRLSVRQGELDVCVTDPGALAYDWTHHNWYDTAEATVGEIKLVLHVEVNLDGAATFTTTLERRSAATDELLAGPFELTHQGGSSWP